MTPSHQRRRSGFSLIELLVVVALVSILAVIAIPSYQEQIAKGRRSTMQSELVRLAQFMERLYSETGCYNPGADHDCTAGAPADPVIATDDPNYAVAFVGAVGTDTFRIRATPLPAGPQAGDGIMEIDQLGQRFWDENRDGDVSDAGEDNWIRG